MSKIKSHTWKIIGKTELIFCNDLFIEELYSFTEQGDD